MRPDTEPRLRGAVPILVLLLVAALSFGPAPARAADEYLAVPAVVKVDGSENREGRVFADGGRSSFLVLVPGESYLYKVDRRARTVASFPRASAMVRKDRLRLVDGVGGLVMEGGLYEEISEGFAFNALSGKRVSVLPSVPLR